VTFFDTSDAYGTGRSERVLGAAIGADRQRVVIATKFGFTYDESRRELLGTDTSREYVRRACAASLRRLGSDYIDLYQLQLGALPGAGRSPAQGALAWIWGRSPRTVPIPGFRNVAQVEDNAGALASGPSPPGRWPRSPRCWRRAPLLGLADHGGAQLAGLVKAVPRRRLTPERGDGRWGRAGRGWVSHRLGGGRHPPRGWYRWGPPVGRGRRPPGPRRPARGPSCAPRPGRALRLRC
jgi:hypothetical protein